MAYLLINMKKIILLTFFLLFSLAFAQEAKIKIELVGFGETQKETYISIHNVGETPVTNIEIFVDGKKYTTIQCFLEPGKGLEKLIFLPSGKHKIEAKTPEGAYDFLIVGVSRVPPRALTTQPAERKSLLERFKAQIVFSLILLMALVLYFLLKKSRLEI